MLRYQRKFLSIFEKNVKTQQPDFTLQEPASPLPSAAHASQQTALMWLGVELMIYRKFTRHHDIVGICWVYPLLKGSNRGVKQLGALRPKGPQRFSL